jgi:hypothetical protein
VSVASVSSSVHPEIEVLCCLRRERRARAEDIVSVLNVLVGASVMSPGAGEIVAFLGLAIAERVPIARLRDLIYPYPTFVRGLEDALRALD